MNETLGRVRSIWRFPVKSFQGESIERTRLTASGVFADRALALRDRDTGRIVSGKHAKLGERVLDFAARYEKEPVVGEPLPDVVARVAGREVRVADRPAFESACSEALGQPVELVAAGVAPASYESYWPEIEDLPLAGASIDLALPLAEAGSFADLEPLHVLTTASLAHLAGAAPDARIDVSRFRPSLLLDTGQASGLVEHDWSGASAQLGAAMLELGGPAPRCIMTTRAQAGLPRDPSVLRTLVRENRREFMGMMMPCLGIYAKVTQPGDIAVGDSLTLV